MISIVTHGTILNLPAQLTAAVIRKYFKQLPPCVNCAEATLHRSASPPSCRSPRPPVGNTWYFDFDKQSGSVYADRAILSVGGNSHMLNMIDIGSDRVFSVPTRGNSNFLTHFREMWQTNRTFGYEMQHIWIDKECDSLELRRHCTNPK